MHCMVLFILHQCDTFTRPLAYESATFHNSATAKLTPPVLSTTPTPVLHNGYITATCAKLNESPSNIPSANTQPIISSSPILFTSIESILPKQPAITTAEQNNRILITSHSFFSLTSGVLTMS